MLPVMCNVVSHATMNISRVLFFFCPQDAENDFPSDFKNFYHEDNDNITNSWNICLYLV